MAHSNTSGTINSPGRKQISLSRSDFLAVGTIHILLGDPKHEGEKNRLPCGRSDLGEGKRDKLSLHESVREEKGERGGKSALPENDH